jgi:arabinoxylan arabinofuranohydrolase
MNPKIILSLIFVTLWGRGHAQNPIVKDVGMSDPHVRVFNDTIFLYCGHDNHPDDTTWMMKEWRIFSTTDMIQWQQEGSISPHDNYMDNNSTDCWAGDAASRNGLYYFYFSDRKRGIGVMASDSPKGPFKDVLGIPLVSPMHDPTILVDDDKQQTPYLIYGDKEGGGFHIARLNEDMISLAETPRPLEINGKEWQDAPQWMDKNYIFKYLDTYYLSWGRDYATSKNIYGPYECQGALGNGHHLSEFAHGSFFWWKGQFYHLWCYYLRPGYKYRETIVTYCHFDEEGRPVTDTNFLDKHFSTGVGQYDASWSEIQAEWYYEKSSETTKKGKADKGFVVSNIHNKSWLMFSNVNFSKHPIFLTANILSTGGSGQLEARADRIDGPLLGVLEVPNMKDQLEYKVLSTQIMEIDGTKDIYLVFTGKRSSEMSLDWFSFSR